VSSSLVHDDVLCRKCVSSNLVDDDV
jgi:hypothetical protein